MKRWVNIFKALANINRLKIVKLLATGGELTVSDISREINISLKGTSKHLIILHSLDVLDSVGRQGHVFYSLNRAMPKDLKRALDLFIIP